MKKKVVAEYELHSKGLLKLVKNKGTLVRRMGFEDNILFDRPVAEYKKNLGAVLVMRRFGRENNVYLVFEDFDGSIKYYDYPQRKYEW